MLRALTAVFLSALVAVAAEGATAKKSTMRKAPAAAKTAKAAKSAAPKAAGPVQTAHRRSPYVGAISANAKTGQVLFEDRADQEAYPASVTKLMTVLLVLEDVKAGKYGFDDVIVATPEAYQSEPSWVGIKVGEKMSVRDLATALMVESANDAAMLLAVRSAGSLSAFVARMNARAAELGMTRTTYYNPSGLPPTSSKGRRYPWKSFNVSTARDQLKLARQLVTYPEVLKLTSIKTCDLVKTADGYRISVTRRANEPNRETTLAEGEKLIKQMRSHNNVMRMDTVKVTLPDGKREVLPRLTDGAGREVVDGLKTGYIDAGGSSIVLTGSRKDVRAIVVVLGSSTSKERDAKAWHLMSDALGAVSW